MACKILKPEDCKCYGAVMKAYHGLLEAGQSENIALDAARIVYSHHHPEDTLSAAKQVVEDWVSEHSQSVH